MKKIAVYVLLVCVTCSIYSGYMNRNTNRRFSRLNDLDGLWSSAKELYGYWDLLGGTENWDRQMEQYRRRLWDCGGGYEYYLLLEEMTAQLQDGHAMVLAGFNCPSWVKELSIAKVENIESLSIGYLPIQLDYIGGEYVVTGREEDCPIPLYARITQVEGKTVQKFFEEEIGRLVGVQTDGRRQLELARRFGFSKAGERIRIAGVTKEGKEFTEKLRYAPGGIRRENWSWHETTAPGEPVYNGEFLKLYGMGETCCLQVLTLDSAKVLEEFDGNIFQRLPDYQACVLDLRNCRGGNVENGTALLARLIKEPIRGMTQKASLKSGFEMRLAKQLQEYGLNAYGLGEQNELLRRGQMMLNSSYYYTLLSEDGYSNSISQTLEKELNANRSFTGGISAEPVFTKETCAVIIGKETASAGETMALQAKTAGLSLVGGQTAGIVGDLVFECLSNGWLVGFSSGNTYGPNGEVIWNRGVKPSLEIQNTAHDLETGRDAELEAAKKLLERPLHIQENRTAE